MQMLSDAAADDMSRLNSFAAAMRCDDATEVDAATVQLQLRRRLLL